LLLLRFRIIDQTSLTASAPSTSKTSKTKVKNAEDDDDDEAQERFALEEEKPQIAGVLDERPEHVIFLSNSLRIPTAVFEPTTFKKESLF